MRLIDGIKIIAVILLVVIMTVFLGFVVGYWYILSLNAGKPDDYNRELYTVVINNNTDKVIDNISVLYGASIDDDTYMVSNIDKLEPNRYRKVHIDTKNISTQASIPYNVWVTVGDGSDNIYEGAGYFSLQVGGFAVIRIEEDQGKIELQRASENSRIYRQLNKRNNKDQNELSW